MAGQVFVVEFAASSSETVVSRAFMCIIAGTLNVFKRALKLPIIWSLPSRVLTESTELCSTFTSQFISLKGRHFD